MDPERIARVLASDRGGLKRVPEGATAVPVVNMCDDEALAETGREVAVDTGRATVRSRYDARSGAADEALRALFRRQAVDEIEVRTDGSYVGPLMQFFQARERRAR